MAILKQLLIAGTLILSMHSNAYDAYALTTETAQILDFAQTLRQVNHPQGLCITQWLEQQVCDSSSTVSDNDIVIMTNIINNPHLTMQSKISTLSQIMAAQKAEEKRITKLSMLNTIGTALIITAFLGCFTTITALSIMEERANPTKKIRIIIDNLYPEHHSHCSQSHRIYNY